MTPRTLFVSRERFRLPLDDTQRRKWDAVGERLDYRIVAAAQRGSPTSTDRLSLAAPASVLDGPRYYLSLPVRVARELRSFRPDVAVVQGVHEATAFMAARALARVDSKLVLDVQGDWHAATRLYGSSARRLLTPLNDALGPFAVRRADAVRTLSPFTSSLVRGLGREPAGEFPPFVDREIFLADLPAALPARPQALFVGVLERYKGFDALAEAWPKVAAAVPGAQLHVVGRGTLAPLARALAGEDAIWTESLDATGVARALDESTLLCLPSRAEGLGRVVVEAMCRGRSVVGGDAGGIPDLVEDGSDGLLVLPGDRDALAAALVRVLGDGELAARLGAGARAKGERLAVTPAQYADNVAAVVAAALSGLP
ncbi:MAG TPA: glycosyltransferase family 4 protein [Gaiellaceae bacterium]|nr:glycosyltransferase family 4 protein [Gaiellaceae bacterium]